MRIVLLIVVVFLLGLPEQALAGRLRDRIAARRAAKACGNVAIPSCASVGATAVVIPVTSAVRPVPAILPVPPVK
jgi:hypothetical protein